MANPFLEPRSPVAEQERRRRERFQLGVYVSLGVMVAFLLGLLIQGCQRSQSAQSPANAPDLSTDSTNAAANAQATAETNAVTAPAAAAAAVPTNTVAATNLVLGAATEPTNTVAAPAPSAPAAVYQIKPGDSLLKIAKAHNTTVAALKAANGLKSDRIMAGKTLSLPAATSGGL